MLVSILLALAAAPLSDCDINICHGSLGPEPEEPGYRISFRLDVLYDIAPKPGRRVVILYQLPPSAPAIPFQGGELCLRMDGTFARSPIFFAEGPTGPGQSGPHSWHLPTEEWLYGRYGPAPKPWVWNTPTMFQAVIWGDPGERWISDVHISSCF